MVQWEVSPMSNECGCVLQVGSTVDIMKNSNSRIN